MTTAIDTGTDGAIVQLFGPAGAPPTLAFAVNEMTRSDRDKLTEGLVFYGATMADDRAEAILDGTWEERGGTRIGQISRHWVRVAEKRSWRISTSQEQDRKS